MSRGMEWLIGAILALIIALVGFYYTKKITALIVPLFFVFYGIYRVISGKWYFSFKEKYSILEILNINIFLWDF